jgi:GxxExxY protein
MLLHEELTERIIGAFYKVYNTLGYGFLESVYENALALELESQGIAVKQQQAAKVFYDGHEVGKYFADVIAEDVVIVELKAAESLNKAHEAQPQNYLKATEIEVGLLLNFGRPKSSERYLIRVGRYCCVEATTRRMTQAGSLNALEWNTDDRDLTDQTFFDSDPFNPYDPSNPCSIRTEQRRTSTWGYS